MDFRIILSFAISVGIFVNGIIALIKKGNKSSVLYGTLSVVTGLLFLAASAIGIARNVQPSAFLLTLEWILYIAGLVIYIIALIFKKKSAK